MNSIKLLDRREAGLKLNTVLDYNFVASYICRQYLKVYQHNFQQGNSGAVTRPEVVKLPYLAYLTDIVKTRYQHVQDVNVTFAIVLRSYLNDADYCSQVLSAGSPGEKQDGKARLNEAYQTSANSVLRKEYAQKQKRLTHYHQKVQQRMLSQGQLLNQDNIFQILNEIWDDLEKAYVQLFELNGQELIQEIYNFQ